MERDHLRFDAMQQSLGPPDLGHSGQKCEDIAGVILEGMAHSRGHARLDSSSGPRRDVTGLDREASALGRYDRSAAEESRHRRALQRGRHDEDAEIGSEDRARLEGERETQVRMDTSLVEFVEDHEPGVLETRIAAQHARQHTLGDDLDAGLRARPGVVSDPVSNGDTNSLAQRLGHAGGRRPRRQPPWLQHHDAAGAEPGLVQQRQRYPGSLPRAWRSLEHGHSGRPKRLVKRRKGRIDGERIRGPRHGPKE